MRPARVLDYVTGTIIALLVVLFAGVTWRQRETDRRVDELRRPANTERKGVFTTDDLEGLPAPVRAYFENTLLLADRIIEDVVHILSSRTIAIQCGSRRRGITL